MKKFVVVRKKPIEKKKKIKKENVKKEKIDYIKIYKFLFKSVREFKVSAILAPILISLEVVAECIIPIFMGNFIDELNATNNLIQTGQYTGDASTAMLYHIGNFAAIVVPIAVFSLLCGFFSGRVCARAGVGLSRNLRHDMFTKIQYYTQKVL